MPTTRFLRPWAATLALVFAGLALAGCGWEDDDGDVFLTNYTDQNTPEKALTFRLAAFGDPFTGNLLSSPLDPGSTRAIGEFDEDYYDAEADMELGDTITWPDVWVEAYEDTYFDIY